MHFRVFLKVKIQNGESRPSSPVRQDGERRTTFLAEYAFPRIPFLVSAHFTFYSDFIQSAKIY